MRRSADTPITASVVNNTLYENDTSATGSGEFQMQWNMADNIFENNIVYAGPRCLFTVNKSQVDKNQPPAVDRSQPLLLCLRSEGEHMGRSLRHGDGIRQVC